MVGGALLNGKGNVFAGFTLCVFFQFLINFADFDGGFVPCVGFDHANEVLFSLFGGESGNLFEHFQFALLDFPDFIVHFLGFFDLPVQGFLFLFCCVMLSL